MASKHEGHNPHNGDGMAHHRAHQHELFHSKHGPAIGLIYNEAADKSGPPDGAPHDPELFAGMEGNRAHYGIAGEVSKYEPEGAERGETRRGDEAGGEHGGARGAGGEHVMAHNPPGGTAA
jgi:hypothetical protein